MSARISVTSKKPFGHDDHGFGTTWGRLLLEPVGVLGDDTTGVFALMTIKTSESQVKEMLIVEGCGGEHS